MEFLGLAIESWQLAALQFYLQRVEVPIAAVGSIRWATRQSGLSGDGRPDLQHQGPTHCFLDSTRHFGRGNNW